MCRTGSHAFGSDHRPGTNGIMVLRSGRFLLGVIGIAIANGNAAAYCMGVGREWPDGNGRNTMDEYIPQPITMREIPGLGTVQQSGPGALVDGRMAMTIITADEVRANPRHYFRTSYPTAWAMMQSGEAAAFVMTRIHGKDAQVKLAPEHWALGAPERARYAAWSAAVTQVASDRQAKERAYDRLNNEGGEGYNPHRTTSRRTYDRSPRRDRDYPAGA